MSGEATEGAAWRGLKAVVIGGGGGIGLEIVRELGRRGVEAAVGDIDPARAASAAQEAGGRNAGFGCDIGDDASVAAFAQRALQNLGGKVDLLFNHAGVSVGGVVELMTGADWNYVLNANLAGLGRSLSAFLPHLSTAGRARVVNTSSGLGLFHDVPMAAPYIASKAGIIAVSRAMAVYLRNRRVAVSVFCPDLTMTGFVTAGRLIGIPPEAAAGSLPLDRVQTPEAAARTLFEGLDAGRFLISAVPDTEQKLASMAAHNLEPGSDEYDAQGAVAPVVQTASFRIPPERRADLARAFDVYGPKARAHWGVRAYEPSFDPVDEGRVSIFEVFRSDAALNAHVAAPETLQFFGEVLAMGATGLQTRKL